MTNLYFVKITRNGTSLAVNIPAEIRRALGIERGDLVSFGVYNKGVICIRKIPDEELRAYRPAEIKI